MSQFLKPTFRIRRGFMFLPNGRKQALEPIIISILSVDKEANTATFAILGSNATPMAVNADMVKKMIEERGEQL